MSNRKSRIASLALLMAMSLGLFAGCSQNGGSDGSDGSNDGGTKDSIIIATANETPSLSPTEHNAVAGSYMNLLTYNTLFKSDMEMNPVPDLVEDYENISESEWEFTIKTGVKFHDGSEMTVEDVKASLEWAKGFPEVSLYNDDIVSVDIVDDDTIKITTPGPDAMLLSNLCHHGNAIVPKALIDSGHDFNTEPIGTGPYKFVEWNRGDSVVFEAFEDYFDGAPAIKNMTWKVIPEGSSRTIALEAGEIDFIVEVEAMDSDRLKGNEELEVIQYEATNESWLMMNNEKPQFQNQNVRHAINSAINKDDIVTVAFNGLAVPAISQCPYNFEGSTEENADVYDVAKAQEYLDASGVDPSTITFSIICSDDQKKRAGEVIQANLKEIGIEANIESMDLATYLSTVAEGNFVAAIGGYGMGDTISYLNGVYHSKSINGSNKSRLNNPEIDAMIDQASATIDQAQREALTEQICAKLNEICTQAPLYQPLTLRAFNADLQGVKVNPNGDCRVEDMSWK